jgi:hypothetical protein
VQSFDDDDEMDDLVDDDNEDYSKEDLALLEDSREGLELAEVASDVNGVVNFVVKGGKVLQLIEHLTSHYYLGESLSPCVLL